MTNLLIIMTDQQRYDSIGAFGNPNARTPNLDALAEKSARGRNHFTPNQICSPSRATLFSGLFPRHHGLTHNGIALDPSKELISHALNTHGFRSVGVGKFHFQPILAPADENMPDSWAFWENPENHDWRGPFYGFDESMILIGESAVAAEGGTYANWLRENHPEAIELYKPENALGDNPDDFDEVWKCAVPPELHYNSWVTDQAVNAIRDTADGDGKPLFLFVSYPDPHHPFSPPAPWCDMFSPDDMPLPHVREGELDSMPSYISEDGEKPSDTSDPEEEGKSYLDFIRTPSRAREQGFMKSTHGISDQTMRQIIAHTHGAVSMIDDCVGRILSTLDQAGMAEDTIIVFTADHGELLGDHGLIRKGPTPYKQILQVPFLISGPGIETGDMTRLTSHVDIKPTLLELLDVPGTKSDGRSFAPVLRGDHSSQSDVIFAEYHPRVDEDTYNQSIITPDWRLTHYPNKSEWGEMFDRRNDPDEHCNLFHDPAFADVRQDLSNQLNDYWKPAPKAGGHPIAVY